MIDRSHKLPVSHQCLLLGLSRSTAYSTAREVSPEDLALMRRIDELHLEHPFAGTRMLRDLLRSEGLCVGRKHIGTLMVRTGILRDGATLRDKVRADAPLVLLSVPYCSSYCSSPIVRTRKADCHGV